MSHEVNEFGTLKVQSGYDIYGGQVLTTLSVFSPLISGGVCVVEVRKDVQGKASNYLEVAALDLSSEDRVALANFLLDVK